MLLCSVAGSFLERNHLSPMLVLSRKIGERILLGNDIRITVVRISGGSVRLGIEAPADVSVVRQEVSDAANAKQTALSVADVAAKSDA